MIEVVRETWNYEKGITRKVYKFNKNKKMKLTINNNIYATQISDFQVVEKDWNCDNDVYELFGAYFSIDGFNDFLTPENIVSLIEEEGLNVTY